MPLLLILKLAGGRIWSFLSHRSLAQLACIALALFAGLQTIRLHGEQRHSAKIQRQLTRVIEAEKEAAKRNKAEVAAKEAKSQRISDNAKSAYQNDLARLRADNERLRAHAKGSAGKSGISQNGPAPEGTDGADELPLPPEELLRAQEIELQLMHLQRWVDDQLKAQ